MLRSLLKPLILALALLATACAPHVEMRGALVTSPDLAEDAVLLPDGVRLPLRRWLPKGEPAAVVIALHGMNDYSNAFDEPGKTLAEFGIATYAYDQRGFGQGPKIGLWHGGDSMAEDLTIVSRIIATRHAGKPIYILGESMGGAVAILALTGPNPPPVQGVILSAPAVWGRSAMNIFERSGLFLLTYTVPWMTLTGRGLKIQASDNIEMLRALGRDPLVIKATRVDAIKGLVDLMDEALAAAPMLRVPTLMLYGEKDEIVPPEPTYRTMAALNAPPRMRGAVYANGWHLLLRDLQARVVLADIAAWIKNPEGPLPSSADRRAQQVLAKARDEGVLPAYHDPGAAPKILAEPNTPQ